MDLLQPESSGEAKRKIHKLAEKNQLKVRQIQKRSTFLYRAKKAAVINQLKVSRKLILKKKLKKHLRVWLQGNFSKQKTY
jgi:hypothetical protein